MNKILQKCLLADAPTISLTVVSIRKAELIQASSYEDFTGNILHQFWYMCKKYLQFF